MKPQELQDAIKAAALKKKAKVEKGEWKEPIEKRHRITREEFAKAKKLQVPQGTSSMALTAAPMNMDLVHKLERERQEWRKEKDGLLEEMKLHRSEMDELRKEMTKLREDMQELRVKNSHLQQGATRELSASPKKQLEASPLEKEEEEPLSPKPHTAESLYEFQRKDKALRDFMKTQKGLFPAGHMDIKEIAGKKIVCFKNRIYVPLKLRDKTLAYYFDTYPKDPKRAMMKQCVWPELEKDFNEYKARHY